MFSELLQFLTAVNSFTPLGVITLLGVVILLLVHKNGPLKTLTDNHLTHVQLSLDKIADASEQQVDLLIEMKGDLNYLKGRLDK